MKPVKRLLMLVIILTLCLSAAACSSANIFGVTNPTTPLENAATEDSAQSNSDSTNTDAYRNDYFQFKCVLPEDWYVLNQEEFAQVVGVTTEALGESSTADLVEQSLDSDSSRIDFYALTLDGTHTINIVLSKAKPLEILLPEQQLLEASLPLLKKGLEDMGATNVTYKTERTEILGDERVVLNVAGEAQGVKVYETIFILRKGLYMSSIAVTGIGENTTQETLTYFQTID